jgi:hypothetical protein
MTCDSSVEDKKKRGCQEVNSCGVFAPSDGMIELTLTLAENTEDGKLALPKFLLTDNDYISVWMTCERARTFCEMLNRSLLDHEKYGPRNVYYVNDDGESIDHPAKSAGMSNLDTSSS